MDGIAQGVSFGLVEGGGGGGGAGRIGVNVGGGGLSGGLPAATADVGGGGGAIVGREVVRSVSLLPRRVMAFGVKVTIVSLVS